MTHSASHRVKTATFNNPPRKQSQQTSSLYEGISPIGFAPQWWVNFKCQNRVSFKRSLTRFVQKGKVDAPVQIFARKLHVDAPLVFAVVDMTHGNSGKAAVGSIARRTKAQPWRKLNDGVVWVRYLKASLMTDARSPALATPQTRRKIQHTR